MTPGPPGAGRGTVQLDGIDLVVFDKDGTLIDFHAMWSGWATGLADGLRASLGSPVDEPLFMAIGYDATTGRAIAGGPLAAMPMARLRELTETVLRDAGRTPAEARRAVDASWHAPDPVVLAHPLADLSALLGGLRAGGRRIGVATSDDRAPTEATLAGLGIDGLVDAVVCADDGLPVKPEPEMILAICARLGIPPARTAMVGDAPADLRMGRAAGAGLVVGVLSGVGRPADLAPIADALLRSVADLPTA